MASSAKQQEPKKPAPPSGFQMGGTPEIDGWYKPEKGHVFQGQIVGRITVESMDGTRDVILVKLSEGCKAFLVGGAEVQLTKGQVLGVGMRHQLEEMLLYVTNKGECWIHALEQSKLTGGRTMWKFEQAYLGKKAPPPEPMRKSRADSSGGSDGDDIPF